YYRRRYPNNLPDQRPPRQAKNKERRGLNENYGRELMELHTLGVNGGYTQRDVPEVARVLTGWTIEQPKKGGGFKFEERMHEPGTKVVHPDRKSTRLNSSHGSISYAAFCLTKKTDAERRSGNPHS